MSAIAIAERRGDQRRGEAHERPPTLDRLITGAWKRLLAHDPAECPVCQASMAPVYGAHARPVGGRCTECGSELR
jgi:hypothetical protein